MYRSKDMDFMNELKVKINELNYNAYSEKDFNASWEQVRRYIVIDDLNEFLIERYALNQIKYMPEYIYNPNNINPDFMFVTKSENKIELDMLDMILEKAKIDSYYRTSFMKHHDLSLFQNSNDLDKVLISEIKLVQPKVVIFFGTDITHCINTDIRHSQINVEGLPPILITSSLLDLFSKDLNVNQINTLKHYIWCDIKQYTTK